ncbi:NAD-dependent epimerase/dehydratase family protein [Chryseobacterium sp. LC2016-27]|uniref:NAD-dependent epimerase/dehydratase family protein n=1 Tax=Chryseobacterium sp. LC2016-27 TaxID=2897326 RepID=UPI001E60756C|nr:NAD-dependent epimerase/dehydratase family protein [Chryseobacterium sp. LC2016-27]MCD0455962.1 NAD-dependent epimerase/dehydratase family protein [Chryseobacterium sp. LC2016-27]
MKIIITGTTGMVGEGVLIECLQNNKVSEILSVSRRSCGIKHPKLKELIISDFLQLDNFHDQLIGYDACFYCAGISSIGLDEDKYTKITFDTTLHFAKTLLDLNPNMTFNYISGKSTDSSEKGKIMWARVKGKTENTLMKLNFKGQYNFRPGFMKHFKEQKNVKTIFKIFGAFYPTLFPKSSLTLQEVGRAMINISEKGYSKQILEVSDIKKIAQ